MSVENIFDPLLVSQLSAVQEASMLIKSWQHLKPSPLQPVCQARLNTQSQKIRFFLLIIDVFQILKILFFYISKFLLLNHQIFQGTYSDKKVNNESYQVLSSVSWLHQTHFIVVSSGTSLPWRVKHYITTISAKASLVRHMMVEEDASSSHWGKLKHPLALTSTWA